jgi:hypothetical protein
VRQVTEQDGPEEDKPDDEHREDDIPSFLGGIGQEPERGEHGAMLSQPLGMRGERAVDELVTGRVSCEAVERRGVALDAQ